MDGHDRPYRCSQPECSNLNGFTYSGGLLRHERDVHFKHGGPKAHRCNEHECSNLPSFASASALSRHIRDVHSKRGGPKEILRCPIDECKRHVGKAFSRMDGLVKHLAAIHGIKKSSAEVRRDYLFPTESPNRQGSREPVGKHDNVDPGLRLQEDVAPREQFKFSDDRTVELKEEQRELKMRDRFLVEERLRLDVRLKQNDIGLSERQKLRDAVLLREQQIKARMLTVQQELDSMSPHSATPLPLSNRLDPHEQRDHDMRSIWEDVEPRGDSMNAGDATAVLRRHQAQLTTLEQQNEMRVSMTQQEQDTTPPQPVIPSPSHDHLEPVPVPDYMMQLMLLEQKNKKRLLMARHEQNVLEQQDKERLLKVRQEQDRPPSHAVAYDQRALPTIIYTPTLDERTKLSSETRSRTRRGQEQGTALPETSILAHTLHDSENNDFTLFDGSNTAKLPAVEPYDHWVPFATTAGYTTAGYPKPQSPSRWRWADVLSDQSAPGFTYPQEFPEPDSNYSQVFPERPDPGFTYPQTVPQGFAEPNFGALYSPTGSDHADAGSVTSAAALEIGISRSGQAAVQQLPGHHEIQPDHRPFRCDGCPASFSRNHDLKRHRRIHLAVKPFPCDFCDKSFSRKEGLKVRCNQISSTQLIRCAT
jgi:hypothetical protein